MTPEQRRGWLLASAEDDLRLQPGHADGREAPEEAAFRDAMRLGQIAGTGSSDAGYRLSVEKALAYFDQATAIRCSAARLARVTDQAMTGLVEQARAALTARDPYLLRICADTLGRHAATGREAAAASAALAIASAAVGRSGETHNIQGQTS